MKILFYIAVVLFCVCACFFFTSICAIIGIKKREWCAQKGEATLLRVVEPRGKDEDYWFEIAYSVEGVAYKARVNPEDVEDVTVKTPVGTRVPICYDPQKPERVTITYNSAKPSDSTLNTDPVAGNKRVGGLMWVPELSCFSAWCPWF